MTASKRARIIEIINSTVRFRATAFGGGEFLYVGKAADAILSSGPEDVAPSIGRDILGGLELLRLAIAAQDPKKELLFRLADIVKDVEHAALATPTPSQAKAGEVDHG